MALLKSFLLAYNQGGLCTRLHVLGQVDVCFLPRRCQHKSPGNFWPVSETPFEWRFADGPKEARFYDLLYVSWEGGRCLLVDTSKPDILSPGLLFAGECYTDAQAVMLYVGLVCQQINGESLALNIQERKKER